MCRYNSFDFSPTDVLFLCLGETGDEDEEDYTINAFSDT
jgi:hypothetical protein